MGRKMAKENTSSKMDRDMRVIMEKVKGMGQVFFIRRMVQLLIQEIGKMVYRMVKDML